MNFFRVVRARPAAIFGLVFALVAGGVYVAARLPAAIFPAVTFPIVKVIADAGEEPAARMMPTVTRPLEEAIRRVPGVLVVRSITSRGSTEISAEFAWGTDMQVALERVQGETQRIRSDLPAGTRVEVEWMNTAIFPILGYALTSKTASQAQLWELAEYTLKPALLRIPGVSQVQVQGGRRREFEIRLDPRALEGHSLSAADVVQAVKADNQVLSAGLAEQNHELYLALVTGRVHGLEALGRIAVPVAHGPPATLADLGQLTVADEVSYIRTTADGKPCFLRACSGPRSTTRRASWPAPSTAPRTPFSSVSSSPRWCSSSSCAAGARPSSPPPRFPSRSPSWVWLSGSRARTST